MNCRYPRLYRLNLPFKGAVSTRASNVFVFHCQKDVMYCQDFCEKVKLVLRDKRGAILIKQMAAMSNITCKSYKRIFIIHWGVFKGYEWTAKLTPLLYNIIPLKSEITTYCYIFKTIKLLLKLIKNCVYLCMLYAR